MRPIEDHDIDTFYNISTSLNRRVRLDWKIVPANTKILRALQGLLTRTDAQGVRETALMVFTIDEQICACLLADVVGLGKTWTVVGFLMTVSTSCSFFYYIEPGTKEAQHLLEGLQIP